MQHPQPTNKKKLYTVNGRTLNCWVVVSRLLEKKRNLKPNGAACSWVFGLYGWNVIEEFFRIMRKWKWKSLGSSAFMVI